MISYTVYNSNLQQLSRQGEPCWFGKRKQDSHNEFYSFYTFKDDRFVAFQAMALSTGRKALQEQTPYLLGAGTPTTTTTNWEGGKVLAFYSQAMLPSAGPSETLDVQSQDFVKGQATARAARLQGREHPMKLAPGVVLV